MITQQGDTLTLTAPSGGVEHDTPVAIGGLVVVPVDDADAGDLFAGSAEGVVEVTSVPNVAIAIGDACYLTDAGITNTPTGPYMGIAVTAAAAALAGTSFEAKLGQAPGSKALAFLPTWPSGGAGESQAGATSATAFATKATIPADTFGRASGVAATEPIEIEIVAGVNLVGDSSKTAVVGLYLGATKLVETGTLTPTSGGDAAMLSVRVRVGEDGASGKISGSGFAVSEVGNPGVLAVDGAAVDWTAAQDVTVKVTWSATGASSKLENLSVRAQG